MRMPQSVKVPMFVGASTVTVTSSLSCQFLPTGTVPEASLMWHQVPVLPGTPDAVQFRVAVPVFVMAMVWPAGVAPPETPEKEKLWGEREMLGAVTV